ncbi:MAG: sulfatase [Kiritimatiellia bacterium]
MFSNHLKLLLLCFLLASATAVVVEADSGQPNIILLLSDDHSYPNLGCYGDQTARTPNLDRLAAQGMRFDRAYTAAPQCVPSRASIMAGRHPVDIDMSRFSASMEMTIPTFAETLSDHGYYSAVMGRDHHIGNGRHRYDFFQSNNWNRKQFGDPVKILDEINQKRDVQPLLLWVIFHEHHRNLMPFKQPVWDWEPEIWRPDSSDINLPPDFPDFPSLREDLCDFYSVLYTLDQRVGRIMKKLEDMNLSDNTIVVFIGDNGAAMLRGKGTLYERGNHVPLIVRWPVRVQPGGHTDNLISGVDLAPTLLAAAGVDIPREMTGRSFLPLLTGKGDYQPNEAIFAQRGAHGYSLPHDTMALDLGRSITTPKYRLIYNALWDRPYLPVDMADKHYRVRCWFDMVELEEKGELGEPFSTLYFRKERPMFELFDLEEDPYELNNLAGKPEYEDLEKDLKKQLAQWMVRDRDFLPLPTGR